LTATISDRMGVEAWDNIANEYGIFNTLMTVTGADGNHLLARVPKGRILDGTSGTVIDGVGGIDFKTHGYIVAPGSTHPNGQLYRWVNDEPIAELPEWFFTDSERPTRKSKPASSKKIFIVGDLSRRDTIAHDILAGVDPDALLGRDTLYRLQDKEPDDQGPDDVEPPESSDKDRTHKMWRIILGAIRVGFDPDALYIRMLDSPHGEGLREHGRDWFDRQCLYAARYHADRIMVAQDCRTDIEDESAYEWERVPFTTEKGHIEWATPDAMKKILHEACNVAEENMTDQPILVKTKIATATGLGKTTVWRAFHGVVKLGWLEEIPEPDREDDWPFKYRLLPAESRRNRRSPGAATGVMHMRPESSSSTPRSGTPVGSLVPLENPSWKSLVPDPLALNGSI
jgi:hypothetical protein